MADKEKRLRKILFKKGWKGKLKSVATLEEAHMIILENEQTITKTQLIGKDSYIMFLEDGYTFSEDKVHYLVSSNPRDAWSIAHQVVSNSSGRMKLKLMLFTRLMTNKLLAWPIKKKDYVKSF